MAAQTQPPPPTQLERPAWRVLVVPTIPGPTPIAVMRTIVARLGGGGVRVLRVGAAPDMRGFGAFRGSAWLTVSIPGGTGLAADYAKWVAQMAVHTYRDQARRRGFRMMDGLTIDAPGARPWPSVMGGSEYPVARRRYPVPSASAALAGVRRRAAMLGLTVARLRVLRTEGLLAPVVTLRGPATLGWAARLARHGVDLGCVTQDVIGPSTVPHGLPPGVSPGYAYPFLGSFTVLRDARGRWLVAQIVMANSGGQAGDPHVRLPAPKRTPSQIPSMPTCPSLARMAADIG